jgi:hypothetical protein
MADLSASLASPTAAALGYRSVAGVYRTALRTYNAKPLRAVKALLSKSCGGGTLEATSVASITELDLSDLYVGNRQLRALFAVAARCPNLRLLAARGMQLFSADVLLQEVEEDEAATQDVGARRPVGGKCVIPTLVHELADGEGYRTDGVELLLDLRDNAELGPAAARELRGLATRCVFVTTIMLSGCPEIDPVTVELITIQCQRNRSKLHAAHARSLDGIHAYL